MHLAGFVVFRGCNVDMIEDKCSTKILENQRVRTCYETCNQTACNSGYATSGGSAALRTAARLHLFFWLPAVFIVAFLAQPRFRIRSRGWAAS